MNKLTAVERVKCFNKDKQQPNSNSNKNREKNIFIRDILSQLVNFV